MIDFLKKHLLLVIAVAVTALKLPVIQDQLYIVIVIGGLLVSYILISGSRVIEEGKLARYDLKKTISDYNEEVVSLKHEVDQLGDELVKLHDLVEMVGEKNKDIEKQVHDAKQAVQSFQIANTFKRRGE